MRRARRMQPSCSGDFVHGTIKKLFAYPDMPEQIGMLSGAIAISRRAAQRSPRQPTGDGPVPTQGDR